MTHSRNLLPSEALADTKSIPGRPCPASLIDAANTVILLVFAALFAFASGRTPYRTHLLVIYPALFLFILAMARARTSRLEGRTRRAIAFAYPIAYLFAIFETIFMVLPYVHDRRYDVLLSGIDAAMMGGHPALWLEAMATPWLNDLMYLCYLLYFPLPLLPLLWMYRKGRRAEVERTMFVLLCCYYVAYLGYFLVPALGPSVHLRPLQTTELRGILLSEPIRRLILALEPNRFDAFPSLHAAILLTAMIAAFRAHRRMFLALLPLAAGITLSLVYCRYHYVIDVVAGFAWAALNYPLAGLLFDRARGRWTPHFGEDAA